MSNLRSSNKTNPRPNSILPNYTMIYTLSINQQNTRKSLIATKELLKESQTDIILIQEPYTQNTNTIYGYPMRSTLYYHTSTNTLQQTPPKSGILISNSKLYTQFLPNLSSPNITTIKVQLHNTELIISSIYIEPNSLNHNHIQILKSILHTFSNLPIILAGDFNARHPLWHDHTTNNNGNKLAELIDDFELYIHNNHSPTCITPLGSSIIDLTITNNKASSAGFFI